MDLDSDGDNLSDYAEAFVFGTSPWHADTDNDLFSDSKELFVTRTSPVDHNFHARDYFWTVIDYFSSFDPTDTDLDGIPDQVPR